MLGHRRVVLGVTGGIAAYKAAVLTSRLVGAGAEVRVVMTASALRFVTALTFESLSGRPVAVETFDRSLGTYSHLELARWAEVLAVVPATANILGKAAGGIADDILSTTLLSFDGPTLFAPAMNARMWAHPAVRDNVEKLRSRGAHFVGPAEGRLACGEIGPGRMAEPEEVLAAIEGLLPSKGGRRSVRGKRPFPGGGGTESIPAAVQADGVDSGPASYPMGEANVRKHEERDIPRRESLARFSPGGAPAARKRPRDASPARRSRRRRT